MRQLHLWVSPQRLERRWFLGGDIWLAGRPRGISAGPWLGRLVLAVVPFRSLPPRWSSVVGPVLAIVVRRMRFCIRIVGVKDNQPILAEFPKWRATTTVV